ncbi:hypothetical protein PHMEG_00022294 [Phytophthora megakarya]|uniref:Reverse transcriptase domain-containing protein n=1 Tax=Phytophthora megakarya TaxID=4795 RepID=A0A225VJK2_9STRA|nr:hypothetical protein PHMEG_00022294 [Phytophthora megakarya]
MLQRNALVWVDAEIVFGKTVNEFLHALKEFFIFVRERQLKLNITKISLFQADVMWRGKLISGTGERLDVDRKRLGRRNKNALTVAADLTETEVTSYNDVTILIQTSDPHVLWSGRCRNEILHFPLTSNIIAW